MEEIIASISRIITEDKRTDEPIHSAAGETSDILELTHAVNEDGSVRRLAPSTDKPGGQSLAPPEAAEPPPRADAAIQPRDRKSTRLNSSHRSLSRMPSSA